MQHEKFLFDYVGFQQAAQPFIQLADQGDYEPVISRAKEIASQIPPRKWVLEDLGTTLDSPDTYGRGFTGFITGFSFLVMLSQFLTPLKNHNAGMFPNVGQTAAVIDSTWSEADVFLFYRGMATTVLVKPDLVPDPMQRPPAHDTRWWGDPEYWWWWVRPSHSFSIGWWSLEQITRFHRRLLPIRPEFERVSLSNTPLPSYVTHETLLRDYDDAMKLFATAIEAEVGMLYITAQ